MIEKYQVTRERRELCCRILGALGAAAVAFGPTSKSFAQPQTWEAPADGKTEPRRATLQWSRREGAFTCMDAVDVVAEVNSLLGRTALVLSREDTGGTGKPPELSIEGTIEAREPNAGFRAVISVSDASGAIGTREVTTLNGCSELDSEIARAVAAMIDPELVSKLPPLKEPEPQPAPQDPPRVKPQSPQEPTTLGTLQKDGVGQPGPQKPDTPASPESTWRGDVSVGIAVGFGWLPEVSPGVLAAGSFIPPKFVPLEFTFAYFAHQTVEVETATVTFYSLQFAATICPLSYEGAQGAVQACGGLEAGFLSVEPEGFDIPADIDNFFPTVGATLRGRGTVHVYGPFHLGLSAGITVPFLRPELVYRIGNDTEPLFQSSPLLGTLHGFGMLAF